MSDANRVALRYDQETVFGVTDSGPPKFKDLRFVSESLKQDTTSTISQEIRSDRQVSDLVRTGISASGDINGELSYGTYDDFLEATFLSSAWAGNATVGPAITISAASADNSYNHSAAGFGSLTVGSWVYVTGFATTANNGWRKILTKTTSKITVSYGTLVNEAAGPSVTVKQADQITGGTTFRSFTIEREYTDLSNKFAVFNGSCFAGWKLGVTVDGIITTNFSILGKKELSATATAGDGAPTAATTTGVMNAIDNVTGIFENGVSFDITSYNHDLANNLRTRLRVGTLGAISIGTGSIGLTGTIQLYYTDNTQFDKYLNWTASSVAFVFTKVESGGTTSYYVLEMPRVQFATGQRVAGGINTDVMNDLTFTAYRDPTAGYTMKLARLSV